MAAPEATITVVEDKGILGVQWWHPFGDLTGYEVRYGVDGKLDNRLAFKLTGVNSNGTSWTAYLSNVDDKRVSCVSAQVRVRFSGMNWSDWSETVFWSVPSSTASRKPSRTVSPPAIRHRPPSSTASRKPSRTVTPPAIRHCPLTPTPRMRRPNILAESGGYLLRRQTPPNSCDGMRDVDTRITRSGSTPPGKLSAAEESCNRTLVSVSRSRAQTPPTRTPISSQGKSNAATPRNASRAQSPAMTKAQRPTSPINTRINKRDITEWEWVLPGGVPYTPNTKSVLVIAPGAPWVWDTLPPTGETSWPAQWSAEALKEAGYDVTVIWESEYDVYPKGWRKGTPDLKSNNGKNHSTLADDYVVPKLKELVAAGRGPVVILAGSRGGQCTLPRLWQLGWRGGAVCVNGGCTKLGKVPRKCRLALVTGGLDFFQQSADPRLARLMPREDPKLPILLYHDPKMGHTGAPDDFERTGGHDMLLAYVLMHMIELASSDLAMWCARQKGTRIDGPWPASAYVEVV